jgi:anti-sigma B factor antagonist
MNMITSVRQAGLVTIVDISGRIVLGEESSSLRDLATDLLTKGNKMILFNLHDVEHIDTSGLGLLISTLGRARKQGGEVKLLNLPQKIEDVMQITKLYTVFDILNDEATAISSFGQSASATA